jgi:glycosyltransferase involved in cell wall biosynthesis
VTEPEVTIVVPTRDRWDILSTHALPSALGQEDVGLEVVVVDDGSQDRTAKGLQTAGDPRLRVIRHGESRGVSAARNSGIAAARGTWLAFLDDDDVWSPQKLRMQIDAAGAAGAAWSFAAAIVVDTWLRPLYALPLPPAAAVVDGLKGGNIIPGCSSNILARRELVIEAGGFDVTLTQGEDWDLSLRLARAGAPAVCEDVLVATVSHGDRSIYRYRPDALAEIERMLSKHKTVTSADRLAAAQWLGDQYHRGGSRFRAAATYFRAAVEHRSPGNVPPAVAVLFGKRAMRLAGRLLLATRGASHLEQPQPFVGPEPDWLGRYRNPSTSRLRNS